MRIPFFKKKYEQAFHSLSMPWKVIDSGISQERLDYLIEIGKIEPNFSEPIQKVLATMFKLNRYMKKNKYYPMEKDYDRSDVHYVFHSRKNPITITIAAEEILDNPRIAVNVVAPKNSLMDIVRQLSRDLKLQENGEPKSCPVAHH